MPAVTPINLDHNATTPPLPEVLDEIARVSRDAPGNPGSRHALGRRARQELEAARERLASLLHARPSELIFTSGGTESINLALHGLVRSLPGCVAAPPGEHPATEETLRVLTAQGYGRIELPLLTDGLIDADRLDSLPWGDLRLATLLLAHNETGVIQDVTAVVDHCRQQGVPTHLDAVQAVGKIDVDFTALGATALSLAAHKFCGPRGIGALLLRDGTPLRPWLRGGHQERDRRPGTECVALAAGMALALELWSRDRQSIADRQRAVRDRLWHGLNDRCAPALLLGHPERRLPNTLNVVFPGCDGDELQVALDLAGVYCSLGSTCASGSAEPAPILQALGVPRELHRSAVRFSLGRDASADDVDAALDRIAPIVQRLRAAAPQRSAPRDGVIPATP